MFSNLRDLPFFDALFPIIAPIGVWTLAHIFYVGPAIVGPRLAEKYYLPQCYASVTRARATLQAVRLARAQAQQRQTQEKQRRMNNLLGGFMRGYFGDEFVDYYRNDPLVKSMQDMMDVSASLQNPINALPLPSPNTSRPSDYCGCVVAENIGKSVSTGLFSASLRIWKPQNIRRLESLKTGLIKSDSCNPPNLNQE